MITGSHIPADRNGLKFYTTAGEISKGDEASILAALGGEAGQVADALPEADTSALEAYAARYISAFGPEALSGLTIGVYQHSSVARDVMVQVVEALGATAVPLGRTDTFTPVDTEAVDEETRSQFKDWCTSNGLDALISTDGDADRPMVTDETGLVVPGDVLGAITARALGAKVICTPISSNTMISAMPEFSDIHLSRIGSPYVIAAMEEVLSADAGAAVVGYEANGGFLLGFEAAAPAGPLSPLMTRDCLLPILASLQAARAAGQPLSALVAALPPRFTAANRLTEVPTEASAKLIAALRDDEAARAGFFETGSEATEINTLDGLRVTFESGDVVHLRPSGNAPELRCYAEADSAERAWGLVDSHLTKLRAMI
jgi:phosphomannomutase